MTRVSVVVPAYNNGDYIGATIESILNQTYTDFELIVADHASTDDTRDVIERYSADPRMTVVSTEAGGGAQRNWNRVSQLANGELVKLVCGDDLIHPRMLELQVQAFDSGSDRVKLVASQRDMVDARGKVFVRARGLGRLDGQVDGAQALRATVRTGGNIFGEPAVVMMRTEALEKAGWWQDLRYYIDAGSYAHVMVQGDVIALRQSLASFRVSASQWSVRLMRQQAAEAAEFHRIAQALAPEVISSGDVRLGDIRAEVLAVQRRLAYVALGKRMKPLEPGA